MSEMTREQAYRRWKKGEDPHKLAKEMGVTRERMSHILKKMDASVPLVDRIEELEAKLAKAVERFNEIRQHCDNFGRGVPVIDERIVERCEDTAANALAELKGQDDDPA